MNNNLNLPLKQSQKNIIALTASQSIQDIATDLTWVDMLKALAIISVFFGNGLAYFLSHGLVMDKLYTPTLFLRTIVSPFVQVFFILSGFGLTLGYLEYNKTGWSWKRWAWRRITKIIFPYYIFVILTFILGIIGSRLYETVDLQFSWISLFSYLTLTRNFYPPSWAWNPPLWYMPVIVGLYIIFPVLIIILKKWGPIKLLLITTVVTYTSLIIAALAGATGNHASDLFFFAMVQFTLGMILAYLRNTNAEKLRLLIGFPALIIGAVFYFFSWVLRTYIPYGQVFNDSVSSIGVFLILLNLGWGIRRVMPFVNKLLNSISKQSYFMYLIHIPVLYFIVGPLFKNPMHPIIVIILIGVYILIIYYLCYLLSKPINSISSKLLAIYDAKNR